MAVVDDASPRVSLVTGRPREAAPASIGQLSPPRLSAQQVRTVWAWLIALSPLTDVVVVALIGAVSGFLTWAMVWFVGALGLGVNALFAYLDRARLRAEGFEALASPLWALLPPPVYLAIRGNRLFAQVASGFRPLWVHILAVLSLPLVNWMISSFGNGFYQANHPG